MRAPLPARQWQVEGSHTPGLVGRGCPTYLTQRPSAPAGLAVVTARGFYSAGGHRSLRTTRQTTYENGLRRTGGRPVPQVSIRVVPAPSSGTERGDRGGRGTSSSAHRGGGRCLVSVSSRKTWRERLAGGLRSRMLRPFSSRRSWRRKKGLPAIALSQTSKRAQE